VEIERLHARFDAIEKTIANGESRTAAVEAPAQNVIGKATPTVPPPTGDFNRKVNQKIRNILMKNPTILLQGQNVKRTIEGDLKKVTWSLMNVQCGMNFLRERICPELGTNGPSLLAMFSPEGGVSHNYNTSHCASNHRVHLQIYLNSGRDIPFSG
jgi:hypothetical protein